MNKKILIITGAVVGLVVIGLAVFYFTRPAGPDGEKESIFSFFFPSSGDKPTPNLPGNNGGIPEGQLPGDPGQAQPKRDLMQLTSSAIAGGAIFSEEKGKLLCFEKATGHLYAIGPQGDGKEQITISTIPKIFDVAWLKGGTGAILSYFETANPEKIDSTKTFLAYSFASTSKEIEGTFLPVNISSYTASPEEEKIFYLYGGDYSSGIIASNKNSDQKQIFSSPFTSFLAGWPKKDTMTLLTRPSHLLDGYLFKLDQKTGALSKIIGPIKGLLSLVSPVSNKVLYSQSEYKTFSAKIYDTAKKESSEFTYKTLPEKCLFSKKNTNIIFCAVPKELPTADYPDDWYKGKVSFTDALWQIDMENGSTQMLLDQGAQNNFDIINIATDKEETFLFFQNKRDGTLWSLRLQNEI